MKKLLIALLMVSGTAFATVSAEDFQNNSYVCPNQQGFMALIITSGLEDVDPNGEYAEWDAKATYQLELWPINAEKPALTAVGTAHFGDTLFNFTADVPAPYGPITTEFYLDESEPVTLNIGEAGKFEFASCMTLAEFTQRLRAASQQ